MNINANFKNRIDSLTSWRLIMIMTILISHLEFFGSTGLNSPNFYDMHFHNPGIGVDFFFILSGFGLTYSSFIKNKPPLDEKWSLINGYKYAKNKNRKLWKLYLFTMIIMLPIEVLYFIRGNHGLTFIIKTIFKIILCLTLLQSGTGIAEFTNAFNSVSWFLSSLFIIYIFYPLIYKFNQIIKNNSKIIKSSIVITLLTHSILAFLFIKYQSIESTLSINVKLYPFNLPYYRVLEFILGVLFCDLFLINKSSEKKINYNIAETALIIFFILYYLYRNTFFYGELKNLKTLIDLLLACLIVYFFAFEGGFISKIMKNNKIVSLGNVSMYIFLIHYPIRIYIDIISGHFFNDNIWRRIFNLAVIIIGTAIMTYIVYYMDNKKRK